MIDRYVRVALTPRLPADEWGRDVALMIVGWLLASVLAVVLLTVVRWASSEPAGSAGRVAWPAQPRSTDASRIAPRRRSASASTGPPVTVRKTR